MEAKDKVRMDQWLAAVRIFKTRSQAANACKKGKVIVKGSGVKPSYAVKVGEVIVVKGSPINRTYRVKGLLEKRVSARLAAGYVEETTPTEELEKLKAVRTFPAGLREKGSGRPTKRERRDIDRLKKILR